METPQEPQWIAPDRNQFTRTLGGGSVEHLDPNVVKISVI